MYRDDLQWRNSKIHNVPVTDKQLKTLSRVAKNDRSLADSPSIRKLDCLLLYMPLRGGKCQGEFT